jgi:pimeloyl-ACP methyl ester carboxylesterase
MSEVAGASKRRAGLVGAAIGLATAGVAVGVAAQRALVRRNRLRTPDLYADELLGQLPYDESLTVVGPDGVGLYTEVVDPTDGIELADFPDGGATSEPTLVFVHGFCLDLGAFHFQRKELTVRGDWRAVYYDQPGHGRSGSLPAGEYQLPALAGSLRAVIDETTPAGQVVLVGHSMGGMTVLAFAERYPDFFVRRVAGVVLLATSAGRLGEGTTGLPELIARVGRPLLPLLGATRLTGGMIDRARRAARDLAWLLTRRYGFGGSQPSEALVSYVERMNSRTTTGTVARYLRALYGHEGSPGLAALRGTPVLMICGELDPITPLALTERMRAHLPGSELVVVPDGGHMVLLEHPEEVNAALLQFLERLD